MDERTQEPALEQAQVQTAAEAQQTIEPDTAPQADAAQQRCEQQAEQAAQEELFAAQAPACPEEDEPPAAPEAPSEPARVTVVDIRFRNNAKTYFFDPGDLRPDTGSHVIIETARGDEYGICASCCHEVKASEIVPPLRKVLRMATAQDERINKENQEKEKRAFDVCQQKILDHKLDMQLVSAEVAFDGSKILFFFTAEGRVDFRELVKDLASAFRTRIELRQIGVRDKAKMVGGLGVCGRPFCCKEFLDDFQPVSIKMAKTQNLSLNPTKISGTCGRLMCCLKYEQEAYEDLLKTAPKNESFVDTPDGRGTVTEVNLLRQSVKVRMEDHPETISSYANSDIYIIRSGKARKNDLPIPRDIAPISSKPRQKPKPAEEEFEALPELIYNSDKVETFPAPEVPAAEREEAEKSAAAPRRRRRRGGRKPAGEGAQNEARTETAERKPQPERKPQERRPERKPQPETKPQSGEPKPAGEGAASKPRRRRRPRGKRPPEGGAPQTPKAE